MTTVYLNLRELTVIKSLKSRKSRDIIDTYLYKGAGRRFSKMLIMVEVSKLFIYRGGVWGRH